MDSSDMKAREFGLVPLARTARPPIWEKNHQLTRRLERKCYQETVTDAAKCNPAANATSS